MDDVKKTVVTPTAAGEATTIRLVPIAWWAQAIIRALRVFIMTTLGVLGADALGVISAVPLHEFGAALLRAMSLAIGPAVVSLLWNVGEHLTKLVDKFPELRA